MRPKGNRLLRKYTHTQTHDVGQWIDAHSLTLFLSLSLTAAQKPSVRSSKCAAFCWSALYPVEYIRTERTKERKKEKTLLNKRSYGLLLDWWSIYLNPFITPVGSNLVWRKTSIVGQKKKLPWNTCYASVAFYFDFVFCLVKETGWRAVQWFPIQFQ